jgi:hypothetical protein
MEPERARAAAVAARLLASPVLAGLSPLEKEEQALLLLRSRAAEMARLLEVRPPARAFREQARAAGGGAAPGYGPQLEGLPQTSRRGRDLPVAASLQAPSRARCREEVTSCWRLLENERGRAALSPPLAAVLRDFPGRYLPVCYAHRKYVHFELAKVERLRLEPGETASLVRAALLLRAGIFLDAQEQPGGLGPRYAAEAQALLRARLKSLPQAVLRSAAMSHLPCRGNPLLPASARLTALFAAAARAGAAGPVRGALPAELVGVALRPPSSAGRVDVGGDARHRRAERMVSP